MSSYCMMNTIKEGVAYGKLGGHGRQKEQRLRLFERAPDKADEKRLQRVD